VKDFGCQSFTQPVKLRPSKCFPLRPADLHQAIAGRGVTEARRFRLERVQDCGGLTVRRVGSKPGLDAHQRGRRSDRSRDGASATFVPHGPRPIECGRNEAQRRHSLRALRVKLAIIDQN
jgi:hypothetical protein